MINQSDVKFTSIQTPSPKVLRLDPCADLAAGSMSKVLLSGWHGRWFLTAFTLHSNHSSRLVSIPTDEKTRKLRSRVDLEYIFVEHRRNDDR